MSAYGSELLQFFSAEDTYDNYTRRVSFDAEQGILTVTVVGTPGLNYVPRHTTHTFRLVEVKQEWVEVDR